MKSKASNKRPTPSQRVLSWDDAVFDPADLVRNVKDLADHYAGKRKLTLRTYTVMTPAPKFTPAEIVELREARNLSRPLFAQLLNVPPVTVRKWSPANGILPGQRCGFWKSCGHDPRRSWEW